jgi:hypothetical protein
MVKRILFAVAAVVLISISAQSAHSSDDFNATAYGANPMRGADDSAIAINSAIRAACLAPDGARHKVRLPGGYYRIFSPIVVMCENGQLIDLAGDDENATTISSGMLVGPAIIVANSKILTSLGGTDALLQAPLVGSIGNSLNWGAGPAPFILDLGELLAPRSLNGLRQIDVRGFFRLAGEPSRLRKKSAKHDFAEE